MKLFDKTLHQQKQIEVINKIEEQVKNNSLRFSTVRPIEDFDNDPRLCLTSVHLLHPNLKQEIHQLLINPLREIGPQHYYYAPESLHMTIKNIRVINYPPHFTEEDIRRVKKIFEETIRRQKKFKVYFYRLLLFPSNLALIGTTDPELDEIVLDLDERLKIASILDDKQYVNSRYFFSNITLVRFLSPPSEELKNKINEFSHNINIKPYIVDSITLLSCNAVFKKRRIIGSWDLK